MSSSWAIIRCIATGRILINTRANDDKDQWAGFYGLFGGRRDPPESGLAAMQRELKEEAGLTVAGGQLRWLWARNSAVTGNVFKSDYWLLEVGEEFVPVLDRNEHSGFQWVPAGGLPRGDYCHPALSLVLADIVTLAEERETDAVLKSRRLGNAVVAGVVSTDTNRSPTEPELDPIIADDRRKRAAQRKQHIEYTEKSLRGGLVALTEMAVNGIKVAEAGVGTLPPYKGRLYGLKTESAHRGKGYAKMLLTHLLASARPPTNLNVAPFAGSPVDRMGLVAFYESFGFEIVAGSDPHVTRMERKA